MPQATDNAREMIRNGLAEQVVVHGLQANTNEALAERAYASGVLFPAILLSR
jgi:hypothetical protein